MSVLDRLFAARRAVAPVDAAAPAVARVEPPVSGGLVASAVPPAGSADAGWSRLGLHFGASRVRNLPPVSPVAAQRHATVLACCTVIAGDLSKVPLMVWQKNRNGTEGPVSGHAAEYLLNVEASPGVPAHVARFGLAYAFALRGRSYAYAPRDGAGELELIDLLLPDSVAEVAQGRERFYMFQDGAGVQRRAAMRNVVHLRYMAEDGWTGRSPIQVAAESVGLALAGQEAAARSASGGAIRGYISMPEYFEDEESATRSAQRIRAALNDPEQAAMPLMEGGAKIERLDMSAADLQLLESRKFDREQLAALYRVPPSKLQMLEHGVKANGQQQAIDYKTDCLLHWGGMVAGFATQTLLTESERRAGLYLAHDWDALMEPTTSELFNAIRVATGGPFETPNEGRARIGKPPIAGGDVLYPPANMTMDAGAAQGAGNDKGAAQ